MTLRFVILDTSSPPSILFHKRHKSPERSQSVPRRSRGRSLTFPKKTKRGRELVRGVARWRWLWRQLGRSERRKSLRTKRASKKSYSAGTTSVSSITLRYVLSDP